MTDTTRDLIQRMARELDLYRQMARDDCTSTHPFAEEARAYLAQPEPEGPTDEELLQIAAATIDPYESHGIAIGEYEPENECAVEAYGSELIAFARAVLTRWGRPTTPTETP
jgi:hypothetical protein